MIFRCYEFTGCGGCLTALAAVNPKEIHRKLKVKLYSALPEASKIKESDVSIVTGCIKREEVGVLKKIREKTSLLVSLGSCSSLGGLTYYLSLKEKGDRELYIVEELTRVDVTIPGCPPDLKDITLKFKLIAEGAKPLIEKTNVCSECVYQPQKPVSFKKERTYLEKGSRCLLEQGLICQGYFTVGGCGAKCPMGNVPCYGCRGPVNQFMSHIFMDFLQDKFGLNPEEIIEETKYYLKKV